MTIFINGKQKRVKRPPTIDGMDVDEFIRRNADPIWLHQNEMWEYIETDLQECAPDCDDWPDEDCLNRDCDFRNEDEPYRDDDLANVTEQGGNCGRHGDDAPDDIPF